MLNRPQQIIISFGIVLLLCSGLFVPFEGEIQREGDNPKIYMGYYFLFTPPSELQVLEDWVQRDLGSKLSPRERGLYSSYVIISRVWIKIVLVVFTTIGLTILFSEKSNDE